MRPDLVAELAPLTVPSGKLERLSPIIEWVSIDYIWTGSQSSTYDFCWDLMTTDTLEQCMMELFPEILRRLGNMMDQINALAISS